MRISRFLFIVAVVSVGVPLASPQGFAEERLAHPHPAVGSWFGRAVELCAPADETCPKAALYMTPTLYVDGNFVGNDSFAIGGKTPNASAVSMIIVFGCPPWLPGTIFGMKSSG